MSGVLGAVPAHAAEQSIRDLLGVSQNYRILFLQGGATLQFEMVPMNFLPQDATAEYVVTGAWGWLAASWLVHLIYLTALIRAFERTDMTVAYPIARGIAPARCSRASNCAA